MSKANEVPVDERAADADVSAAPESLHATPADAAPSPSAADIRDQLRFDIEEGTLKPGTALDERSLAARFGVSRTKVRQALHQLTSHDLIRIEPYFGARVTSLSISELRDILEYCSELEVMVTKLAARRMSGPARAELEKALDECREAVASDNGRYAAANKAYHEALCHAACSPYLVKQLNQARRLLLRYVPSSLDTPARIQRSLNEHEAITKAVLSQNEQKAADLMAAHLPMGSVGFSEFLARIPASHFESTRP